MVDSPTQQPPIRRSKPPKKKHYSEYQEYLRKDFFNSCAYCTVSEKEAGGVGFNVEHYVPKSAEEGKPLEHQFDNLLWACGDCNSYKGIYHASAAAVERALVVIRPDTMVPSEHLKLEEGCPVKLAFKTPTGEFNICRLDLNRPGLQELRSIRIMLEGCSEYVQEGVRALSSVSLDGLRPRARGQFIKLREKLVGKAAEYDQGFDDLLRDFARSPLRKADPDRRERTKARKARLEELLNPPDSL